EPRELGACRPSPPAIERDDPPPRRGDPEPPPPQARAQLRERELLAVPPVQGIVASGRDVDDPSIGGGHETSVTPEVREGDHEDPLVAIAPLREVLDLPPDGLDRLGVVVLDQALELEPSHDIASQVDHAVADA